MVEYFEYAAIPGKPHFRCDRLRATLSKDACKASWLRAENMGPVGSTFSPASYLACKLCPIGAKHADAKMASMAPLKDTAICSRCHNGGLRLIRGTVCVSCYNREREMLKGVNAKGTAPQKHLPLSARRARYRHGEDVVSRHLRFSVDVDELVVSVLRESRKAVVFGFHPLPPADLKQLRLW